MRGGKDGGHGPRASSKCQWTWQKLLAWRASNYLVRVCMTRRRHLHLWGYYRRGRTRLILTAPCGGPRIPIICEAIVEQETCILRSSCLKPQRRGYKCTTSSIPIARGWLNTIDAKVGDNVC
ncbi:hypothetical protein GGI35DRAFT_206781 [Trichoderma velutinum]